MAVITVELLADFANKFAVKVTEKFAADKIRLDGITEDITEDIDNVISGTFT